MRSRVYFVFLVLLYRALLDLLYYVWISPYFSYAGLVLEINTTFYIALSYILLILSASIVPIKTRRPSEFIIGFLYLVSYVPLTSLVAFGGFSESAFLWLSLMFVLLLLLFHRSPRATSSISFGKEGEFLILVVFGFFVSATLALLLKYGFKLPSTILDVYGIRSEYKASLSGDRLIAYILPWLAYIIIPFIVAWSLINRKVLVLFTAILGQLYIFAIAGLKGQFFALFFIIWLLIGVHYFKQRLLHYMTASLISLLTISNIIDGLFKEPTMTDLLRRLFFVPAQLYCYYYDFFGKNAHTYLSQSSIFGWFLHYPYDLPIPNLIGDVYFLKPETTANANLWADSYASFGVIGMFIFSILLWLTAVVIDRVSWGKNDYLVYTLLAMPTYSLTNSSLQITMLTHGALLSIFLILLLPKVQDMPFSSNNLLKSHKLKPEAIAQK